MPILDIIQKYIWNHKNHKLKFPQWKLLPTFTLILAITPWGIGPVLAITPWDIGLVLSSKLAQIFKVRCTALMPYVVTTIMTKD